LAAFSQENGSYFGEEKDSYPLGLLFGNVQVGIPFDDFKEAMPSEQAIGASGGMVVMLGPGGNIGTGLAYSYLYFGKEKKTVRAFGEEIRLKTTNNTHLLHGVIRFSPTVNSPVQPYFDALIGFSVYNTHTKLNIYFGDSFLNFVAFALDEPPVVEPEVFATFNDVVFTYGGALGFTIGRGPVRFDARVLYLLGGEAEYVQPGSVEYDGLNISYQTTQSKTNLLIPQIGVIVGF